MDDDFEVGVGVVVVDVEEEEEGVQTIVYLVHCMNCTN